MHINYDCQPLSESKIMKSKDLRPLWCWFCHDALTTIVNRATWSCRRVRACLFYVTHARRINSAHAQLATGPAIATYLALHVARPGGGGRAGACAPCAPLWIRPCMLHLHFWTHAVLVWVAQVHSS